MEATRRTLFTARSKTRFHSGSPQNPAQAEAEDDSKIKDRLEALLCAETLQGTLSPNANPGKGSVGGLLNWMPKAAARIQRAAQTHQSLVLDSIFYTKPHGIAQEENQKSYRRCTEAILSQWSDGRPRPSRAKPRDIVHKGESKSCLEVHRRDSTVGGPSPSRASRPGGDARFSTGQTRTGSSAYNVDQP